MRTVTIPINQQMELRTLDALIVTVKATFIILKIEMKLLNR